MESFYCWPPLGSEEVGGYDEGVELSEERFSSVETIGDFINVYKDFYRGKIVVPGYLGPFICRGDGGSDKVETDNPFADVEMAKKFYAITEKGLICTDSQVGDFKSKQKAYISGWCNDSELMTRVIVHINRHNGLIAYALSGPLAENETLTTDLIPITATHRESDDSNEACKTTGDMLSGEPCTRLYFHDVSELEQLFEWVDPRAARKLMRSKWYAFTLVDANFDRGNYLLNILHDFLRK